MTLKSTPEPVTRLIEAFTRLPGIGSKTASRLTYYLLRAPDEVSAALALAAGELKLKTKLCKICFNICEGELCPICQDPARNAKQVAVVEEPLDILALERAGVFVGRYHVLHGVINPREGVFAENLRIRELMTRVASEQIEELILSTNVGMEGDATAQYIKDELGRANLRPTLSRLARGLPQGSDLEYLDAATISRALQGRQGL
jgi:recombination protein RecR